MSGELLALIAVGMLVLSGIVTGSVIYLYYFRLWFRSHVAQCSLSLPTIMGMTLRKVSPQIIVNSYIDLHKAGIPVSIELLEDHYRGGARVRRVAQAMVVASRQGQSVDFEEACALDLAGKDVMKEIGTVVDFAAGTSD
ncbi:MAG: flotillin-like FloA family protein [Candidatus Hydrogenedentota bacterium]